MAKAAPPMMFTHPFRFGFFAGLGFFVASMVMSVVTFLLIGFLGFGTLFAAILTMGNNAKSTRTAPTVMATAER